MSNEPTAYTPDQVSPPGATLAELLEGRSMTQAELAARTGRPKQHINEIVAGKAPITHDMAIQLERSLGAPAAFWNTREARYREHLARQAEHDRLSGQIEWLAQFPVKEMTKWGWLKPVQDKVGQVRELLNYFGVASPVEWRDIWSSRQFAFRKSEAFEGYLGALSAWLRRGEVVAREIASQPFDEARLRASLRKLRALTLSGDPREFVPRITELCAATGVAVVFVPELTGCRASGVTQWLTPEKALIQLSLRYKTDDHLWFTFFHEVGHILLHGKKEVFVEWDGSDTDKEHQANRFAAESLIPAAQWKAIRSMGRYSKAAIRNVAASAGVAPGIVVGRLQHERLLPPSHCNDLKRRYLFKVKQ
ncbi:MAG: ImmA/IrrE family metallo-endopeptidase [Acidobacteria bacterium]|nr:ImmA/IrrE family metallo-endopeptidase [Acidobacteriota bacterium]